LISECVFFNCSANPDHKEGTTEGVGGSIALYSHEGISDENLSLSLRHLYFHSSYVSNVGLDVTFIRFGEADYSSFINESLFLGCRSESVDRKNVLEGSSNKLRNDEIVDYKNRVIIDYNDSVYIDISCLNPSYFSGPLYIGSTSHAEGEGGDEEDAVYKSVDKPYCGIKQLRCRTISYGLTTRLEGEDLIINVESGEYEEGDIGVHSNQRIEIVGKEAVSTILITIITDEEEREEYLGGPSSSSIIRAALITIPSESSNSLVFVSQVTFIHKQQFSSSLPLLCVSGENAVVKFNDVVITSKKEEEEEMDILETRVIFFSGSGESVLSLNNVIVKNLKLKTSFAFITDGDVTISQSTFKNISVTNTGTDSLSSADVLGGAFNIIITPQKSVEIINSSSFDNCSITCTAGKAYGGAVYLELSEGGEVVVGGGTVFNECSAYGVEGVGFVCKVDEYFLLLLLCEIKILKYLYSFTYYYFPYLPHQLLFSLSPSSLPFVYFFSLVVPFSFRASTLPSRSLWLIPLILII
jgi:hypothetical protein